MGELGIRPDVIDRCQNHIEAKKVTRTYQRQKLMADRKEAFDRLGDRLQLLAGKTNSTVVADLGEEERVSARAAVTWRNRTG
jgi:hypothetical protein